MNQEGVNKSRRRFLTATTAVVGGVGAVFTAYPFLASWQPSARAQAAGAPVEVDISRLEPGQLINIEWRGRPVWVFQRDERALQELEELAPRLADPESRVPQQPQYAENYHRSIRPEVMVMVGICTHLGCSPLYRPEPGSSDMGGTGSPGGFFCPCHGSRFDLAGRVFRNLPAPTNMEVPPHFYIDENQILIGEEEEAA
ncbi:ubiquinol-cytochrome c reductase iron-sulfur subunit [Alkalilimnicola ehrlichii]|uniref:Ubiquinol-cytochrome c reductase iron-sulfur subunit n=1 Tax=Alkalilimnicola ehrlichii TaxID=351052 RepID=A0A3E0WYJ0_9GAMM|nr:ubiquinol-cytochrome c reductase iron-sulfur subunit [Alkalilimnicola ehrlichii]RFA30301.1 ubiquinol-cytochrome c reductase iron-sulfur subunit [Alkalilimnicola ehrlichii]RFA37878.1 ubiquinol-cytochrome c reductase iron-sulfur subunit [Alkalilimnicola ehrlichii]